MVKTVTSSDTDSTKRKMLYLKARQAQNFDFSDMQRVLYVGCRRFRTRIAACCYSTRIVRCKGPFFVSVSPHVCMATLLSQVLPGDR